MPICKNKKDGRSDAGNYRPVSLATTISKLFEHYILSGFSTFVATTDNQFGLNHNMELTYVYFHSNKLHHTM